MTTILDRIGLTGSIRWKLIVLFLLVSIIPIITVSYMAFEYGSASTEERVMAQLTSIADLKENEIENWVEEQKVDIQIYSDDMELVNLIDSHNRGTTNLPKMKQDATILLDNIDHRHNHYKRLTITNNSGAVIVSTDPEDVGDTLNDNYITDPISTKDVYIKDIFKTDEDEFSMILSAPVFSIDNENDERSNEVIGVLIIEMDMAESLYPMIESWPGMGDTGETLLVRREGNEVVFISELRHLNESALYLHIPINSTDALPAIRSSGGEEGIMITGDYMGERVLSAYRHIDLPNWGFVAKIDETEAFAGIDKLRNRITTFSIVLILFVFGMAIWISTSITRPIIHLEELTKKVAQGDFSEYPKVTSNDEIGSLTSSFVKMETDLARSRRELEDYSENLQHKVDERTNELMENEEKLQETSDYLNKLIDYTNAPFVVWNPEFKIERVNHAFEDLTGYTADEMVNTELPMYFPEESRQQSMDNVKRTLKGEYWKSVEMSILQKDGNVVYMVWNSANLYDKDGKTIAVTIAQGIDISQRKELMDEIKQMNIDLEQKVEDRTSELTAVNKELEAFSYSVSHDLRAPLRSVDGFSQALLEDYGDKFDETGIDYLNRVRNATLNMEHLIDDLLNLSRITRGEVNFKDVDLSEMVSDIAEKYQTDEFDHETDFTITKGLKVNGDERLLKAMLENLISNAYKFSSKVPIAKIEFGIKSINDEDAYYIRDNGVGFDMKYADKLFGAFQRLHSKTEFPGTGIGLATVQRIIHKHGGRVWAESELGKGSTFYFTI